MPFSQQNKIRIFNTASLFISFICIFYTLLGFAQQRYLTVIFTFSEFLFLIFGFFLIYKRKYNLGFHFGLITGILFLIGYSLLFGEKSQTHIFLLFMPVAGIILFDCFTTIFVYFVLSAVFLAGSKMMFALFEPYYPTFPTPRRSKNIFIILFDFHVFIVYQPQDVIYFFLHAKIF